MKDRGMAKWMPYKSLSHQAEFLAAMSHERGKREKPLLSSEAAEAINDVLTHYGGEKVRVRYFEEGYLQECEGTLQEINSEFKFLRICDKNISFPNLLGLQIVDAKK